MGVGLLQPYVIVAIVTLKQYIGNIRLMQNVGKLIVTIKKLLVIKTGYGGRCIKYIPKQQYRKKMWIDNVNDYLTS